MVCLYTTFIQFHLQLDWRNKNHWLLIIHSMHHNQMTYKRSDKDKDLFIGPQEFVVGYSKAPEQPQSSARPICHSHTMTRTGREPATVRIAA